MTDAAASVQSSVAMMNSESSSGSPSQSNLLRLLPLRSLKVLINGKLIDAMIDSGAQIVLLNRSVLNDDVCSVGQIQVQGVFGNAVTADIVPVDVKRCNDDVNDCGVCMLSESMQLFCGLVDNIASGYDMILPADIAVSE